MKKVLIYDLWMCMMAWILFLNDQQVMGMVIAVVCAVYNCYFVRKMNLWRVFSIFMISMLVGAFFVLNSAVVSVYRHIFPFLFMMMFDYALMNEVSLKLRADKLVVIYLFIAFTTLFTTALALLIPETVLLPQYKTNALVLDFVIFFPAFIQMTVCLLTKMALRHGIGEKMYN